MIRQLRSAPTFERKFAPGARESPTRRDAMATSTSTHRARRYALDLARGFARGVSLASRAASSASATSSSGRLERAACAIVSAPSTRRDADARSRRASSSSSSSSSSPEDVHIAHTRTHVTKELWRERLRKAESGKAATKLSEKLVPRAPQTHTAVYVWESDEDMREMYRQHGRGAVRMGRILEDLDSLAGNIAFFHADDDDDTTKTPQLVTASVDRVRLNRPLSLDKNVVIRGEVAFVGTSSMVIRMEADDDNSATRDATVDDERTEPALAADFTFVARDPETNAAWPVNPLICETRKHKERFQEIQASILRKRLRKKKGDAVLNDELIKHRTDWVRKTRERACLNQEMPALTAGYNEVLTTQTMAENMFVAQPQQRNLSGRVFGGFLLRRAYELAYANCQLFSGGHPMFVEMSDIDFKLPVSIGDLVRFKCKVMHTVNAEEARCGKPSVYLEVRAIVTNPHKVTSAVANTFYFKFNVAPFEEEASDEASDDSSVRLRRVLPESNDEGLQIWDKCIRRTLCDDADFDVRNNLSIMTP